MTSGHIARLLEIASGELAPALDSQAALASIETELRPLLQARNGFYAFESALLVRPEAAGPAGVDGWNASSLWRDAYEGLDDGLLFFAEDIFGFQFALDGHSVVHFDPETAERTFVAESVERWAAAILQDYAQLTGHPIAHEWQAKNGRIPSGYRLVAKVPFVLGGEFALSNLHLVQDYQAMRARGALAVQIHDAPDGTTVSIEV